MGSNFRQDKIGALSEAGGTISLAPSILTIGGRQLETTSSIGVAAVLTANTRFQVYAVNNSGVVQLVVSQNENSVGPLGWTSWKLVGSYSVNTLSSFGGFFNVKDSSGSVKIRYSTVVGTSVTGSPTVVDFNTKTIDTHNAVTGTGVNWIFTAPKEGYYSIQAQAALALTTNIFSEFRLDININGGLSILSKTMKDVATSTTPPTLDIQDTVYLSAGDTVSIAVSQNGAALTLNTGGWANHVSIIEESNSTETPIEDL